MSIDSPDWVRQITSETDLSGSLSANILKLGVMFEILAEEFEEDDVVAGWHPLYTDSPPDGELWLINRVLAQPSYAAVGGMHLEIDTLNPPNNPSVWITSQAMTGNDELLEWDNFIFLMPNQRLMVMFDTNGTGTHSIKIMGVKLNI
jgi:hypothetical protein